MLSWTKPLPLSRFLVRPSSLVFMGWFVKHLSFSACIMFLASLRRPRGWTPVSLSISVIGVDRTAPAIRRSARPRTLPRACRLVFAVVDHFVEPHSRRGLTAPWHTVLSTVSLTPQAVPASFAKNSHLASGFSFCSGNVLPQGPPLVKCDTKVCCFFILLQRGPTKSDGAGFLLWGRGEQGGGRFVPVDCNTPFLCPAVEPASRQPHPARGCSCTFLPAPNHQVICIQCCPDAPWKP